MTIPKTVARFNAHVTNRASRPFAGRLPGFAVVIHVGRRLAAELDVPFVDGDDKHTPAAKARMAQGIPLDDEWRAPWLDRLDAILRAHEDGGLVLACSALKRAYRRRLIRGVRRIAFV